MIAALVAWIAIWPRVFAFDLDAAWRCILLIGVLAYLLFRDLRAVSENGLPDWYGPLRIRLTIAACSFLGLIAIRLALWGFY